MIYLNVSKKNYSQHKGNNEIYLYILSSNYFDMGDLSFWFSYHNTES